MQKTEGKSTRSDIKVTRNREKSYSTKTSFKRRITKKLLEMAKYLPKMPEKSLKVDATFRNKETRNFWFIKVTRNDSNGTNYSS